MNIVIGIIVALLLAGGAYWFVGNNDDAPVSETKVETKSSVEYADTDTPDTSAAPAANEEADAAVEVESETAVEAQPVVTTPAAEPVVAEPEPVVAETRVFNVSGTNFAFDAKEMRVKEGDTVTVNFTSASGFHDWVVDEFSAATTQVRAGESASVTFVASKKGTFEYYCSVGSHRANGMVGNLIVE